MRDIATGRFTSPYKIVNDNIFSNPDSDAYWLLGMLASDGNVHDNCASISQSGDVGLHRIERITNLIGCTNPIYHRDPSKGQTVHTLHFTSKQIVNDLIKYNIISNKTNTYEFPDIPPEYLKFYLEGYIEGDGTVGIYDNGKGYKYLTILVVGTEEFVTTLNTKVPIKGNVTKVSSSSIYQLKWTGRKALTLGEWLYETPSYDDSVKYLKYYNYVAEGDIPDFNKYDRIRSEIQSFLDTGHSVMDASMIVGVPFQSTYAWIKDGKLVDRR
jgi:hypothetical protein